MLTQWRLNFWDLLPQEAVEADSIRRLKKVHKKLPEGIGRDVSFNILNITIADAGEFEGTGLRKAARLTFSLQIASTVATVGMRKGGLMDHQQDPAGSFSCLYVVVRRSILRAVERRRKLLKVIQSET